MSRLTHSEIHMVHRIGWLRAAVLGANDGLFLAMLGGQTHHDLGKDTCVAPSLPTVVQVFVRSIVLVCITPSQAIAINEDNPVQDGPIISPLDFRSVNHDTKTRSMGPDPRVRTH